MKHITFLFFLLTVTACGPEDLEELERPELVDSIPHHIVIRSHEMSKGGTYEL